MIVKKYPAHSLSNNSLYWSGEIYYSRKQYKKAIQYFNKLVKEYPKGNKVPDGLLKTGYSYLALGDKKNARKYLKEVVTNFPFSRAGSIAEKKLNQIK